MVGSTLKAALLAVACLVCAVAACGPVTVDEEQVQQRQEPLNAPLGPGCYICTPAIDGAPCGFERADGTCGGRCLDGECEPLIPNIE